MIFLKQYLPVKTSLIFNIISALFFSAQCIYSTSARAESATIAVASNFLAPAKALAIEFENNTGHHIKISSGSTGKLYAQIIHGAPYDAFFAANQTEPQRLEDKNLVEAGSRFTYAMGSLVLWSNTGIDIQGGFEIERHKNIHTLSIANPRTAPYGAAAMSVINKYFAGAAPLRLVRGENVGQAYQYVKSGSVKAGFVSRSQVLADESVKRNNYWLVPQSEYDPINQQAVLLERGRNNAAAREFLAFIRTSEVISQLTDKFGYFAPQRSETSVASAK